MRSEPCSFINARDGTALPGIPPYTPEMNPIEQIWTEIRKRGFKNVIFKSLDAVRVMLITVTSSPAIHCVFCPAREFKQFIPVGFREI